MIKVLNQTQILDKLSKGLAEDVLSVRAGTLSKADANSISRLASKSISAIAKGVMLANHHEIQVNKIEARNLRTVAIENNTEFKNRKLNLKYNL